jgi:hypothetical protein
LCCSDLKDAVVKGRLGRGDFFYRVGTISFFCFSIKNADNLAVVERMWYVRNQKMLLKSVFTITNFHFFFSEVGDSEASYFSTSFDFPLCP